MGKELTLKMNSSELQGLMDALEMIGKTNQGIIEKINNNAAEIAKSIQNASLSSMMDYDLLHRVFSRSVAEEFSKIASLSLGSVQAMKTIADIQTAITIAQSTVSTDMINELAYNFSAFNIQECQPSIQRVVNSETILMADYSFLKTTPLLDMFKSEIMLPKGFVSDIKNLNVSAAKRVADNERIVFDTRKRLFIKDDYEVTTRELNCVCDAAGLLDSLSDTEIFDENELIDFMSHLERSFGTGLDSSTGQKIRNLVKEIDSFISFDRDVYYHSRPRKRSDTPYVGEQMLRAPYGVSSVGRFNHLGQSHYYFSDTKEGSVEEISKHIDKDSSDWVVQTAKITSKGSIRLLDLSDKGKRRLKNFISFISKPCSEDSGKRPREYLIPQFLGDCCIDENIDGIKYYGGKDYSNYVTWKDGYFDYAGNVGDTVVASIKN